MYHEAEKTLQDAIKQMPTNALFYYSLGVLMGRLNRLEVSWFIIIVIVSYIKLVTGGEGAIKQSCLNGSNISRLSCKSWLAL